MNNNNFALLRYFRDLGADAHLLLYDDDGRWSLEHFAPEADTWEIERWLPYISRIDVSNSVTPALSFPWSWMAGAPSLFRTLTVTSGKTSAIVTRRYIRNIVSQYDVLIGSGNTPALCEKAGTRLDVFAPYCIGVEYVGYPHFEKIVRSSSYLKALLLSKMRARQIAGIKASRFVLNAETGLTEDVLVQIGVQAIRLFMPMVYTGPQLEVARPTEQLTAALERIRASSLSVMHHARLQWVNSDGYTKAEWGILSKNNDWLFRAFAEFAATRPSSNPLLVALEYGKDINQTKKLAIELGIQNRILWLPKMQRRELMWLLQHVHIGCGEFHTTPSTIWGGTGWETLASGKPLMHCFNFGPGEFESRFGFCPPPMLSVACPEDIYTSLCSAADSPETTDQIGRQARVWFDAHAGIGLARKWLELIRTSLQS